MSVVKVLAFTVGHGLYAFPIWNVEQALSAFALPPFAPSEHGLLGFVAHRGRRVPVYDSHLVLGLPAADHRNYVVLSSGDRMVAMTVDRFRGIMDVDGSGCEAFETLPGTYLDNGMVLLDPEAMVAALPRGEEEARRVAVEASWSPAP